MSKIRRNNEYPVILVEKAGGNGKGIMERCIGFYPEEMHSKQCTFFARLILNPGCSLSDHAHETNEEIYYVLSGTGLYNDNGVETNVYPGDAMIAGNGEIHGIENNGDKPLVLLAVIHNL